MERLSLASIATHKKNSLFTKTVSVLSQYWYMFNITHLFCVYNKMISQNKNILIPSNISNELFNLSVDYLMVAVITTTLFLWIKLFEQKRKIHNLSESFLFNTELLILLILTEKIFLFRQYRND